MANDSEPTWGDSVAGPPPGTIPNQRSMPVTGGGASPHARQPYGEYQRPTAQPYSVPVPPAAAVPYPESYPVISSSNAPAAQPYTYPQVPPVGHPVSPAAGGQQQHPPHPPVPVRDSFVTRLMTRGVQGSLLAQPWFQDLRQRNADPAVYASFGIGVFVSIVLNFIPSSFVVTVLTGVLWAGIGFMYFALGTRLAHQFIEFGICLVGGLVMLARVLSAIIGLAASGSRYYGYGQYAEPAVVLMMVMLINLAGAGGLAYIGVQVHRGIQRMSQP